MGWLPWRPGGRRRRSRDPVTYFGVVEPGTTTLRLLVVEVTGGQATVWGWAERPGADADRADLQALVKLCREALAEAEEMARDLRGRLVLPDQILVGLPASTLRGGAWPVAQRRSRPDRPVEERELAALLDRAQRLTVNRLGLPDAEPDGGEPDWLVVDAAPVSLVVDGRGVTDPVGFRGREVGATVFAAMARYETIEAWQDVAQALEFSTLTLAAAPLALTASLSGSQGILVDVGGATTDLIVAHGKWPVALASLPLGGEDLSRLLIQKWRLTPSRAGRLKQVYAEGGKLDEEAREQVLDVLSPGLRDWLEQTESALEGLNWEEPLPYQLYLLGGGSGLPEMADAARALAWSERLQFARYPQVGYLRPTDVPGVVNRTEYGRKAGDVPALALAAWAARQSLKPDRPARILEELSYE